MSPLPHEINQLITGELVMHKDPAQPQPEPYVYQRARKGKGNIERLDGIDLQLRRKGQRTDRITSKNAPHRARFAAGHAAWLALTETERNAYRERAGKLPITGYNLWMRDYLHHAAAQPRKAAGIKGILGFRLLEIFEL